MNEASRNLLFSFTLGFMIRLIPEVLSFPYPIGFDTVYYAARIEEGVIWYHWSSFFASTWLIYAILVPLHRIVGGSPFMLLKIFAPVFYGLNVAGIYWFANKGLGWSSRNSLLAGAFFAVQLASLRISWDLLRNILGMALLLFTLSFIGRLGVKSGYLLFMVLSLLTVFAHEYAAVTLLFLVLSLIVRERFGKKAYVKAKGLFLGILPALAFFLASVYFRIFPVYYGAKTNVIWIRDAVQAHVEGIFFLVNYLVVNDTVDYYASYFDLVLNVFLLFSLLYLPYLVLVWKGFFRHELLDGWTALLMVGAFGCLMVPFSALRFWYRWMFMLVYPLTFYSVNWLRRSVNFGGKVSKPNVGFSNVKVKAMILLTVVLGGLYLATPVLMSTVNVGVFSVYPVSRYFSSAPTVPYRDVGGVVNAMEWLNGVMNEGSCVILQHAFLPWGKLHLDGSNTIIHFKRDIDLAVETATENGFSPIFFVWWNQDIGWYNITVPKYFVPIKSFSRISVFKYVE